MPEAPMLGGIRDVSALLTLERALGRLREEYMDATLAGRTPGPSFWHEGEARVLRFVRDSHFAFSLRTALDPQDRRSDEEAWADREGIMGEETALWTHERLREIPFVGDGVHDEPEAAKSSLPAGSG